MRNGGFILSMRVMNGMHWQKKKSRKKKGMMDICSWRMGLGCYGFWRMNLMRRMRHWKVTVRVRNVSSCDRISGISLFEEAGGADGTEVPGNNNPGVSDQK